MKQFFFSVALATILLTATSGYNEDSFTAEIGGKAPQLNVSNQSQTFSLEDESGHYTLISFWDSSDAQSRVAMGQYQAIIGGNTENSIELVGINMDESEVLYEEILKADGLNESNQYRVEGDAADRLRARYGLDEGLGSVLVGPDGRVVKFNPTAEDLKAAEAVRA